MEVDDFSKHLILGNRKWTPPAPENIEESTLAYALTGAVEAIGKICVDNVLLYIDIDIDRAIQDMLFLNHNIFFFIRK